MRRLGLACVFAAVAWSIVAATGGAEQAAWTGYDLSGAWTNPAPAGGGKGTSLVAHQSSTTLRWKCGPNSGAWIQTFVGTVTGSSFSGAFRQDDSAHAVNPRYHGHMEAEILDSCHFEFTLIAQAGQPTLHGSEFTR